MKLIRIPVLLLAVNFGLFTVPNANAQLIPSPDGLTVYDTILQVNWLAKANLAGTPAGRFGVDNIDPGGAMDYSTALQWVQALNNFNGGAGYLGTTIGRSRLPLFTTRRVLPLDLRTTHSGPVVCSAQWARCFIVRLVCSSPIQRFRSRAARLVRSPIFSLISTGPIRLAQTPHRDITPSPSTLDGWDGFQCINPDGSMTHRTAENWIAGMNTYNHGAGWLGQTNWQLPPILDSDFTCSIDQRFGFGCRKSPMGELFYGQLH